LAINLAAQNVGAVLYQCQSVLVAELSKTRDRLWKTEVMDCDDRADFRSELHFKVQKVGFTVGFNRKEIDIDTIG
jgi:hypothetical protein